MSLKEIFESQTFIENRRIELSDNDVDYSLEKLRKGKELNLVRPLLSVVETRK